MSDMTLAQEQEQDAMLLESQIEDTYPHPEDFCDICGGNNFSWVVDSDRFNLAASAFGLDRGAVLCIDCFVEGHEKATGLICSWKLEPATPFRWRNG